MPTFLISSLKEFHLRKLGSKEIIVKKIVLKNSSNIHHLFQPISVVTKYANGSTNQYMFNAIVFFSNRKPGLETDKPIGHIINECYATSLMIHNPRRENFDLEVHYSEYKPKIEELEIKISSELDGFVYSLSNLEIAKIKKIFPDVFPVNTMFVSKNNKADFESLHGDILPHVIDGLTGLDNEQMKEIRKIKLVRIK